MAITPPRGSNYSPTKHFEALKAHAERLEKAPKMSSADIKRYYAEQNDPANIAKYYAEQNDPANIARLNAEAAKDTTSFSKTRSQEIPQTQKADTEFTRPPLRRTKVKKGEPKEATSAARKMYQKFRPDLKF